MRDDDLQRSPELQRRLLAVDDSDVATSPLLPTNVLGALASSLLILSQQKQQYFRSELSTVA